MGGLRAPKGYPNPVSGVGVFLATYASSPRHVSPATSPQRNTPTPETGLEDLFPVRSYHGMAGYAYINPLAGLTLPLTG